MKINKIATALVLMGLAATAFAAKTPDQLRVYINPGHGSWTGNDRPMEIIGKPEYSSTNTDTTGFFESNTNLIKGFGMLEKLIEMGVPFDRTKNQTGERWEIGAALDLEQNIVMSRVKNGPFEAENTTSSPNAALYNRSLLEVSIEVDENEFDQFVSIHSNAASKGSTINYHLFMYRGHNGKENVLVPGSWEMAEAAAKYSFANEHAAWSVSSVYINGDIDFMGGAGYEATPDDRGYVGYLKVLKHSCPGFLVEGYFHTYYPAAHRAMNFDVDWIEGCQYARGVAEYFELENRDATGEIYGIVRDQHERFSHRYYTPNPATDDIYKPLNGATAELYLGEDKLAEYTTDEFYNGAFVFKGLQPGVYTLKVSHPDYKDSEPIEVEVKGGATSYPKAFLEATDYVEPIDLPVNYPDPLAKLGTYTPADEYDFMVAAADLPIDALAGKVIRRVIVRGEKMYILALDKNITLAAVIPAAEQAVPTVIVYDLAARKVVAELSTAGTSGSIAPVADLQLTADGYLLACNATKTQYDDSNIQAGDAGRGTFYIYKWDNDEIGLPTGDPQPWISTQNSGLWFRAYPTHFAFTGTTEEGSIAIPMPTVGDGRNTRASTISIFNGEAAAAVDYKPGANNPLLFEAGDDVNFFVSPLYDEDVLCISSTKGLQSWGWNSPFGSTTEAAPASLKFDGRAGIFKYAGASYVAMPLNEGDNNVGIQLVDLKNDVKSAANLTLNIDTQISTASAVAAAAAGETVVVRDEAEAVTDAWINLYLLREGKLTILTTNPAGQPSAVGDIIVADTDAAPVYYNLQGVRVAADNLTPGVYVKVVGARATKVVVK